MITRRRFVGYSALGSSMLAYPPLMRSALAQDAQKPVRLAIIGSTYTLDSDLQTIADRFLVGFPFEGDWHQPNVQVVSLYVDEYTRRDAAAPGAYQLAMSGKTNLHALPELPSEQKHAPALPVKEDTKLPGDLSAARAKQFGFRLCRNIPEALRCGGEKIAVDAVLVIVEQCHEYPYPVNDKGQVLLPRYDFFQQCAQVFETEKHSVPYFNHKQLSYGFLEAQEMVKTSERLRFPLMSGSSMPVTWRLPGVDVPFGAKVEEAVMVGVGGMDNMDFDALEAMQAMLERRKGGETGVKAVQLLEGDDVWTAMQAGRWSKDLLVSALSRSDTPLGLTVLDGRAPELVSSGALPQLVKDPAAYCIEYNDGTKATLLMLNGAIRDYNIAVSISGAEPVSAQFLMPVAPNQGYSACLAARIDAMYQTRTAQAPLHRALLTTGVLEACLNSRHHLNQRLETAHLNLSYQATKESQFQQT
ncbi:MAG: hypothetical protein PW789_15150 [Edaphobacter sp.]|uniref:hypothetical protein n=1 Tax=Edaphobacter sp. TaxID=1934404 RepID=UPI00239F45DB|nr:hypothetical protein [Edaphobacter sp.]MDE1177915.1 hypothetical protein [Edaphobacter sp.]